jgi:hypothetical protein
MALHKEGDNISVSRGSIGQHGMEKTHFSSIKDAAQYVWEQDEDPQTEYLFTNLQKLKPDTKNDGIPDVMGFTHFFRYWGA